MGLGPVMGCNGTYEPVLYKPVLACVSPTSLYLSKDQLHFVIFCVHNALNTCFRSLLPRQNLLYQRFVKMKLHFVFFVVM